MNLKECKIHFQFSVSSATSPPWPKGAAASLTQCCQMISTQHVFGTNIYLESHIEIKHTDMDFLYGLCGEEIKSNVDLRYHMKKGLTQCYRICCTQRVCGTNICLARLPFTFLQDYYHFDVAIISVDNTYIVRIGKDC